ncbi:MAG: hypothetical protein H6658_05110 [Ardenticatenaceae bacterium]|nr:hypothetical protein [Ardenticatenaceae bacterium]
MAETTFTTTEEVSNRDVGLAVMMLLGALGLFWHLDSVFRVSAYFWYSLGYVLILSPFVGLVLHKRPLLLRFSFLAALVTAVFFL